MAPGDASTRAPGRCVIVQAARRGGRLPAPRAGGDVPSTCSAVTASQTKKLTLCSGSSTTLARARSAAAPTPVAKTTTVESTTSGASSRSSIAAALARRPRRSCSSGRSGSRARHLQRHGAEQQHAVLNMCASSSCRSARIVTPSAASFANSSTPVRGRQLPLPSGRRRRQANGKRRRPPRQRRRACRWSAPRGDSARAPKGPVITDEKAHRFSGRAAARPRRRGRRRRLALRAPLAACRPLAPVVQRTRYRARGRRAGPPRSRRGGSPGRRPACVTTAVQLERHCSSCRSSPASIPSRIAARVDVPSRGRGSLAGRRPAAPALDVDRQHGPAAARAVPR